MTHPVVSRKILFSNSFKKFQFKIIYLDVGARGDIDEPWVFLDPEYLKVIGFEPDEKEADALAKRFPNRKYFPYALWGQAVKKPYYLCRWNSTSSMYPPNVAMNSRYERKHWEGRVVEREVGGVPCVPLDSILQPDDVPDFIKIDTHGAEFEILKGAQLLLRKYAPLVLVETWCAEVYKKQPLFHEVYGLMADLGYDLFDFNVAAAWKYANAGKLEIMAKAKIIGFHLLFIKRPDDIGDIDAPRLIKLVALSELYGFRDYSLFLLEQQKVLDPQTSSSLKKQLIENSEGERSFATRVKYIVRRLLRLPRNPYPSLK